MSTEQTPTTTVDVVIRLTLDDVESVTPAVREALDNLADVMLVQAEDGLYSLGWKDAENVPPAGDADDDGTPNEYVADISGATVQDIREVAQVSAAADYIATGEDADLVRFLEQNPDTAETLTADQLTAVEQYARHYSGGLYVLVGDVPGRPGRYVKVHDTWADDGPVIVHGYDLDPDEDDPERASHVESYATGREAVAAFLDLLR